MGKYKGFDSEAVAAAILKTSGLQRLRRSCF